MSAGTSSEPTVGRSPVTVERTSDREVRVTRLFNAPVHLVFEAWTKPELFRQWWLPRSMGMTLHGLEMNARTGGRYHLDFGEGAHFYGTYVEVTPHSRIVWTNDEGGEDNSVTTVSLQDQNGGTLLVMSEVYPSPGALEAGAGAEQATHETFGQLDDLLAHAQVRGTGSPSAWSGGTAASATDWSGPKTPLRGSAESASTALRAHECSSEAAGVQPVVAPALVSATEVGSE